MADANQFAQNMAAWQASMPTAQMQGRAGGILPDSPGFLGPMKGVINFDAKIMRPARQANPGFFGKAFKDMNFDKIVDDFKQANQNGWAPQASLQDVYGHGLDGGGQSFTAMVAQAADAGFER